MSDNEKSGEPAQGSADLPAPAAPVQAEAAPAETPAAAPAAAASPAPAAGTFGSTRGSGLARGKRTATTAPGATPASTGYKPTSIEVIAPASEYKNPFTGETSVSVPRTNEPAPQAAPVVAETAPANPVPAANPAVPAEPAAPTAASDEKPELKILPPEQAKRAALRWESSEPGAAEAQPRREERPTFRPDRERREGGERREPRQGGERRDFREGGERREGREGRTFDPREPRQRRPDERPIEPRSNQPYQPRPSQPQPEKKAGGFVGWLKGLFGGKAEEPTATPSQGGEPRREGEHGHRHRHRGGRGRHQHGGGQGGEHRGFQGENRGPRPEGQPGEGGGQHGGEPRGEGDFGGRRRRRRRGGRGRNNRGEPRAEGQQGGGAI